MASNWHLILLKTFHHLLRDICQTLMKQYPDQIDGLQRYAELWEARGDKHKAAEYYRKAAAFAQQTGDFAQETIDFWFFDVSCGFQ